MGASSGVPTLTITVSPTCLWSTANVAAPNTIWSLASRPCPDRIGRSHLGARAADQEGDGLAVDLGVGVGHTGPRADVGVMVEQLQGLGRDVVARVEHVVPVPPVQRWSRYQGVQTAGEGERADQQGDGQDGSQQRRANRHCGSASPRLEGEAHPHRAGDGHTGRFGAAAGYRATSAQVAVSERCGLGAPR